MRASVSRLLSTSDYPRTSSTALSYHAVGRVAGNVFAELRAYVSAHDLGSVETECGFRLSEDEPTVRGPDVAFIARDRLPAQIPGGFWPFAPDLAIEVASPSNSLSDLQQKVLEYFDAGSRMVWVIDPQTGPRWFITRCGRSHSCATLSCWKAIRLFRGSASNCAILPSSRV